MTDSKLGKSILITIGIFIIAVICWLSAGYRGSILSKAQY